MSLDPDAYWPELLAQRKLPKAAEGDPLARAYYDFAAPEAVVLGHLGQSLDGCIATGSGHAAGVTGPENIIHLHRLRALADAVLVGAGTVAHDDPRLTTRLVEGLSPVRVVIDSRRRLGPQFGLFREGPPSLVVCAADAKDAERLGRAEITAVAADADGRCRPEAVIAALAGLGLKRLFIEGGGETVSRFLQAGCLDILEVCIAPVLIGEGGRRGINGPRIERMEQARRLDGVAIPLGPDTLHHFVLKGRAAAPA